MKYLCPRDFRRGEMEEKMNLFLCQETMKWISERLQKEQKPD